MLLTKAQILAGRNYTEQFFVEELQGEVTIRPLTDGEYTRLQLELLSSVNLPEGVNPAEIDLSTFDFSKLKVASLVEAQHKMEWQIVAWCLVDEEPWTLEEVQKLPPGVPSKIAKKVLEISGVGSGADRAALLFRPKQ